MTERDKPTHQSQQTTVIGCMVFSVTKHRAPGTGPVGTAQLPNNSVSVGFCTMREPGPAIGQRMSKGARSIVSRELSFALIALVFDFDCWMRLLLFFLVSMMSRVLIF